MQQQINQLHELAMERLDSALAAERAGMQGEARSAFRQAFQLERAAAELVLTLPDQPEPTRSVLLRSAASLALDCGQRGEAVRLARLGLERIAPDAIAEELKEVLERARGGGTTTGKSADSLDEARRFVEAVGGADIAREALDGLVASKD